jgi:hypothetical protein
VARRGSGQRRTSYEARTIRSRFSNTCYACNGPIQLGDLIIWSPSRRGQARHSNCHAAATLEPSIQRPTARHQTETRRATFREEPTDIQQQSGFVVRAITAKRVQLSPLNLRCPYCKDSFQSIVGLVKCDQCSTHYHPDCFKLNGKCSVFGCSSKKRPSFASSGYNPNEVIIENTGSLTTLFQNTPNTSMFSNFVSEYEAFVPVFRMLIAIAICVFLFWLLFMV